MGESLSAWRERLVFALRNPWAERGIKFVLVPALVLCSLWLPPISLGARVFHTDLPLVTAKGGTVGQNGGAQLTIPSGALSGQLRLLIKPVLAGDKQAGQGPIAQALKAVPANLDVRGALYRLDAYGSRPREATLTAPLPAEAVSRDAIDLYGWTGKAWQWLPSRVEADTQQLKARLGALPKVLAVMETKPQPLAVGVDAPEVAAVNAAPLDLASELYVAGLSLNGDGSVTGQIALDSAPANLLVLPTLSNRVNGVARTDWTANIITQSKARAEHIKAIVEAVDKGGYKGLNLQYEGLDPSLRQAYATFVAELADSLHKAGKVLAVRVDEPAAAVGGWESGGYDLPALSRSADLVRVPVFSNPAYYAPGGPMEQSLRTAVGEMDRHKLQLVVSANCYEQVGNERKPLIYGDALSLASKELVAQGESNMVLPGQTLSVTLANLGSGFQVEPASNQLWFAFNDQSGVEHKIWIENADSIARKLALASQFSLHGVAVENLAGTANDAKIWDALRLARETSGRGDQSARGAAATGRYSVVWKVESKDGQLVQQGVNAADQPVVNWTAAENPGDYLISVAISEDGGKTTVGQPGSLAVLVPSPTPSPTPKPTNTPRPAAAAAAPVAQGPAPRTGVPFGYGIQVDMVTDTNYDRILGAVQQIGFGWIKQQIEWFRYNSGPGRYDWGRMDAIVDACAGRGIKVMFSVCKAPKWARPGDDDKSVAGPPADPNTYAEFLRQMATRYRGRVQAYEIWNEQNLYYEWGGRGGRLNAAKYVELLRAAYGAIKSADPGAIVISGAPTPTGWNDGDIAIDDQAYLRQMYQAGLRSVCDAVGAHPSGYNNPPDADWGSWTDPSTNRAKGHPSWFFRSTMEGYHNIMAQFGDGYKRIVPTEFGWASVDGMGVAPVQGYEYAADNTADEQAQFITRAYQLGKNWGFVGPMFLWNLNFAPVCGAGDEKAAFSIVNAGWGPRPAFSALAGMPK